MKKAISLIFVTLLLAGCTSSDGGMDRAMELRTKLLNCGSCSFSCAVTADYGDKIYSFRMDCTADAEGNLQFTAVEPDTIAGITGRFMRSVGALTFDDAVLTFPLLADEQVTPVSAPWILVRTLRSGYLTSAGRDGELLRVSIDDSYEDDALRLDIWLNEENAPVRGEILYRGRKILSMEVENFEIR